MPTSADRYAVDTSVAVAALDMEHTSHAVCAAAIDAHRPALAGHAVIETYSVLTRMPGGKAIDSASAARLLRHEFPEVCWPSAEDVRALLDECGRVGVVGGAIYDALVGIASSTAGALLLTRDRRAMRTYQLLGVEFEIVDR